MKRALRDTQRGLGERGIEAPAELLEQIAIYANGDARAAYNILELAVAASEGKQLQRQAIEDAMERKLLLYDKSGEEHYNLVSALHKSVRSSDPDAAPLLAGQNAGIRRRPALHCPAAGANGPLKTSVWPIREPWNKPSLPCRQFISSVFRRVIRPWLKTAIYLSIAPKSDAAYQALNQAQAEVRSGIAEPVPRALA